MRHRWTASMALALVMLPGSCGGGAPATADGDPGPVPPAPPPLALQPRLPELQRLAATGPAEPAADRLEQLLDLGRTAFEPGAADPRLAARSRAALLAEPDALWALEQLLLHEHSLVRSQAAFALGELGQRAGALPLSLRLKYERDPEALVWVADALAALGNGSGLHLLVWAMDQAATAEAAGRQAVVILTRAGRPPAAQPAYADLQAAVADLQHDWHRTGLLPPDAAEPAADPPITARIARRLLVLPEFQLRPVDDTRFILSRTGRLGVPLLRLAITASEPYLRSHALEVLRDLGPCAADAAPDVLPLLGDPLCRADAVRALGAMRARSAAPLLRAWLRHPEVELRAAAAGALGPIGDRQAEPRLQALMADATEAMDVRVQAAFSLALFELDRPARRFLQQRLRAGDYHAPTLRELVDRVEAWR